MTALPPVSDLVNTGISKGTFKAALTNMRGYLSGLFGDTGDQQTALAALGAPMGGSTVKSGAYTVVAADRGKVLKCSGTWTLSLTAASTLGDGFVFEIVNDGSGVITIDPNLSELIDGATTKQIIAGASTFVFCDGSKFLSVGGSLGYTAAKVGSDYAYDLVYTASSTTTINFYSNYGAGLYGRASTTGLGNSAMVFDTISLVSSSYPLVGVSSGNTFFRIRKL